MRRLVLAALALAAAAAPATASAAPLPTLGAADGVSITAVGDAFTVRFASAAAGAVAAYDGRTLTVDCDHHPARGLLFADAGTDTSSSGTSGTLRPAAGGALELSAHFKAAGFDVCAVERTPNRRTIGRRGPFAIVAGDDRPPLARVALNPAGAAWIDELGQVVAMENAVLPVVDQARYPLPAALVRPGVVALDGPGATPPAGTVGYWSDGALRYAVVATSAAGRRLVVEELGNGITRSNVEPFSSPANALVGDGRAYYLDTARTDADAHRFAGKRAKAVSEADGLRATLAGSRLTVRFAGRSAKALRAVAGRRVSVTCNPARLPVTTAAAGGALDAFRLVVTRAPRRGTVLRARVRAGASDVCAISDDGATLATLAPTAAGRGLLTDLTAASALLGVSSLAPKGATAYPSAATLAARRPSRRVALPGPDAYPRAGDHRLGLWTGGDQVALTVTSPTGHHFVMADEGNGVVRTNLDALLLESALLTSIG